MWNAAGNCSTVVSVCVSKLTWSLKRYSKNRYERWKRYTCVGHLPWMKLAGLKLLLVNQWVSGEWMWRPRAVTSTGVPEEFLKHVTLDELVRGINLFFLRLSNKTITNTSEDFSVWMNKNYTYFCQIGKEYIFGSATEFSNLFMCAMRLKRLKIAALENHCQKRLSEFFLLSLFCSLF